jgi:hypothetical protein
MTRKARDDKVAADETKRPPMKPNGAIPAEAPGPSGVSIQVVIAFEAS